MDLKKIEEISIQSKAEKWTYPKTFKALKEAGVASYEVDVATHQIIYFSKGQSFRENAPKDFRSLTVQKKYDLKGIKSALDQVRLQKINYAGFLEAIALAGVKHYKVDMSVNTVTYYGSNSDEEYAEKVPQL
jgi:uncharacterized protein YbcV (DUF1398 family)